MPWLSVPADHAFVWITLAAALWATGDRQARRAAWRGLGSMATASAVASILSKGLAAWSSRGLEGPVARRRVPLPPFVPAGHAATAAAFATGAAIELPYLAAATRPPRRAPAAAAGEGLVLMVNISAGTASARLAKRLAAELPQATIIETDAGQDLAAQLRVAADGARILGLAGGDGTVSAASAVALGRCRVYYSWRAGSAEIRPVGNEPIWLSVEGEVATAESGFTLGKHQHGLLVYRSAAG